MLANHVWLWETWRVLHKVFGIDGLISQLPAGRPEGVGQRGERVQQVALLHPADPDHPRGGNLQPLHDLRHPLRQAAEDQRGQLATVIAFRLHYYHYYYYYSIQVSRFIADAKQLCLTSV